MDKDTERRLGRKIVCNVCRDFLSRGFVQATPTFLVRPLGLFAQFVHFHKFRFGRSFRVQFGVRVMNDPFEAVALNGPAFEHAAEFSEDEGETLACARKLAALIEEEGFRWFFAYRDADSLLASSGSPLSARDRQALGDDLNGKGDEMRRRYSRRLLGLPD